MADSPCTYTVGRPIVCVAGIEYCRMPQVTMGLEIVASTSWLNKLLVHTSMLLVQRPVEPSIWYQDAFQLKSDRKSDGKGRFPLRFRI